nr:GFA family protein [Parerythrobacter lacustris]
MHICHCSQCRQSNGSAFNLALVLQSEQVDWLTRDTLIEFESSPGKLRSFCRDCGSPVYSRREDLPATFRLRAGLFANLPKPETFTQGYRNSAWPWADELFALTASNQELSL